MPEEPILLVSKAKMVPNFCDSSVMLLLELEFWCFRVGRLRMGTTIQFHSFCCALQEQYNPFAFVVLISWLLWLPQAWHHALWKFVFRDPGVLFPELCTLWHCVTVPYYSAERIHPQLLGHHTTIAVPRDVCIRTSTTDDISQVSRCFAGNRKFGLIN